MARTCGPPSEQPGDDPRFTLAKIGLAIVGEDLADGLTGGKLDLGVGVGEGKVELGGEAPADRGLAGPHQADQHDASRAKSLADCRELLGLQVFLALSQSSPSFVEAALRGDARRDAWGPHGSMIFSC